MAPPSRPCGMAITPSNPEEVKRTVNTTQWNILSSLCSRMRCDETHSALNSHSKNTLSWLASGGLFFETDGTKRTRR
jgi:hypothetical protein